MRTVDAGLVGVFFGVIEGKMSLWSSGQAIPSMRVAGADPGSICFYDNIALSALLIGRTRGAGAFGILNDRIDRTKTMMPLITNVYMRQRGSFSSEKVAVIECP